MDSLSSPEVIPASGQALVRPEALRLKFLVVGGFAVGKTTFVQNASQKPGVFTEAPMTRAGESIDDLQATPDKTTTTVSMDFGRTDLPSDEEGEPNLALFLFGVPGQDRFHFMWDQLAKGALGGVVLVDTDRVADCFPSITHLERHGVPFVVAVNHFPNSPRIAAEEIRDALQLPGTVPVLDCDARERSSALAVLTALVTYLYELHLTQDIP
jgi:signal recognition particle receptor subunit beta